jgi:4-hydroxybenzoate polyprenyltransferase
MAVLQIIILSLLITIGIMQRSSWAYYLGVLIAAALSVYQQSLIFHRNKALCFKAFLNNNWFGLAIFMGLVVDYGLR